jgi:hypothetical protein
MRSKLTVAAALTIAVVGLGLALAPVPAHAHHAFAAEFDANSPVDLEGTVIEMQWINPHAWIHIGVENSAGEVTEWMIEAGAPNGLIRRGFTRDSLLPGTKILVSGYRAKDGATRANGSSITFEDGRKLFVGGSNPDLEGNRD